MTVCQQVFASIQVGHRTNREICTYLKLDYEKVRTALRGLKASGKVRLRGIGRGATWTIVYGATPPTYTRSKIGAPAHRAKPVVEEPIRLCELAQALGYHAPR